jgi:hypothetical protein
MATKGTSHKKSAIPRNDGKAKLFPLSWLYLGPFKHDSTFVFVQCNVLFCEETYEERFIHICEDRKHGKKER